MGKTTRITISEETRLSIIEDRRKNILYKDLKTKYGLDITFLRKVVTGAYKHTQPVIEIDSDTLALIKIDRSNSISISDISKKYNIPKYTLYNHNIHKLYPSPRTPIKSTRKLSKQDVEDIKAMLADKSSKIKQTDCAKKYNVSKQTINNIAKNKTFKYI